MNRIIITHNGIDAMITPETAEVFDIEGSQEIEEYTLFNEVLQYNTEHLLAEIERKVNTTKEPHAADKAIDSINKALGTVRGMLHPEEQNEQPTGFHLAELHSDVLRYAMSQGEEIVAKFSAVKENGQVGTVVNWSICIGNHAYPIDAMTAQIVSALSVCTLAALKEMEP